MFKLMLALLLLIPVTVQADVYVEGYYRKDGTYVSPHYRSDPNGSTSDNWSTKGNVNPYTGEKGYKDYNSGSDLNKNYGGFKERPGDIR